MRLFTPASSLLLVAASITLASCGREESVRLDSSSCGACHAQQMTEWQDSHHALAEQELEPGAVVVRDIGPDGKLQDYPALRSIGVAPLVQYIVELDGRLQVPQQARDSRDGSWFSVFADDRQPGDWGHWTGRGMNWDTMCATCHNTDLHRTWNKEEDTFTTTWLEHGVACTACHENAENHARDSDQPILPSRQEQCWPCHAQRTELASNHAIIGNHFLDLYMPGLPDFTETWHVDGQIQEEDFEFTSFALSKMYQAGVTCLDCHDPHTAKLRREGNDLCMTCHSGGGRIPAPIIQPETHSGHQVNGRGNACIDCHMSTTIYMQRHARHDHGFHIPDPRLSLETGVPNACNKCHTDRTSQWAADIVEARPTWKGNSDTRRRARAMFAARQKQQNALPLLLTAIQAETQSTWRATLLGMLQAWPEDPDVESLLKEAATAEDPLQRAMAWPLPALLTDPVRAVRLNAARGLPWDIVAQSRTSWDVRERLRVNRGQPAGALQEAQFELTQGRAVEALQLAQIAELWESSSPTPLHLQATALDSLGRTTDALATMKRCCERFPDDPTSWYFLGLAAAAEQDHSLAKQALQTALRLQPDFAAAARNLQAIQDFEKQ